MQHGGGALMEEGLMDSEGRLLEEDGLNWGQQRELER